MKYPIGIQHFESLRKDGYAYVDKTQHIYNLVNTGRYYFLSRPRRFGKSLLLSTIRAYFEGKKELFEGLALGALEEKWEQYPILYLDLNVGKYDTPESLTAVLSRNLELWEEVYGDRFRERSLEERFWHIIRQAYEKAGQGVVILVDEYDKPMLQAIGNEALQAEFRSTLKAFYGNLKSCDEYIKFAFLTGVTKFGKVSVFSDFRNGDAEGFMRRLEALFADGDYQIVGNAEVYFQNTLYVFFKLLGLYVEVERHTSDGRMDILMQTTDYIYILELKVDKTAAIALRQIEDKGYAAPFANDPRKLYKTGVNFSSETHKIDDWKVVAM